MTNRTFKRLLGRMWQYLPRSSSRPIILIYHSVGTGPWALPVRMFEAQMLWLKEHAQVLPLDSLLSLCDTPGLHVSLTFDDGYKSLYTDATHILKKYNLSATVYLNTGCISDNQHIISDQFLGHYPSEAFLLWREVLDLQGAGWTIGSHGVDHIDLTKADAEIIERQARDSKAEIESRLGIGCEHFSYTWGHHNKEVRNIIANAGYRYAVGGQHAQLLPSDDLFMLPRLNISREYTLDDFIAVVTGAWDFMGFVQRLKGR